MTATHEPGHRASAPSAIAAGVRDEVLRLGPEDQLVGIVSHPAAGGSPGRPPPSQPALIILNAGVLHRIGPHRLHVLLARRIAAGGMAAFRLDLGGIGDSMAASDAATFRDSAVADTKVAMTGLGHALGSERFVLFGVCSGADNSIATALVDDRVAGIILVDPPAYATRRSQLRELRRKIAGRGEPREVARWAYHVVERRVRARLGKLRRTEAEAEPGSGGREIPPPATFGAQLQAVIDRGVKILCVFSGIHGERYNHPDQLFELYPALRGRLDHLYYPTANHTFTELAAQAMLLDAVTGWVRKRFAT